MENYIIEKRKEEVFKFIHMKEGLDLRYDYAKALLIEALPFRDTTALYSEMALFSQRYGRNIMSYCDLITCICAEVFPQYDSRWIKDLLDYYGISNISFAKNGSWLLGKNIEFTENDISAFGEYLKSIFYTALNEKENKRKLGYYAEYLVKEYLASNPGKYSCFKWVPQEIGDGFGYDFFAFNEETNKWEYIEVKTKSSGFDSVLSPNETRKMSAINGNDLNEEYAIFIVPIVLNGDHFEYDIIKYSSDGENEKTICRSLFTGLDHIVFYSLDAQKESEKAINGEEYKKIINLF